MNTETTGMEKDAPELTAEEIEWAVGDTASLDDEITGLEQGAERNEPLVSLGRGYLLGLLSMARRTAEAEEKVKAAETERDALRAEVERLTDAQAVHKDWLDSVRESLMLAWGYQRINDQWYLSSNLEEPLTIMPSIHQMAGGLGTDRDYFKSEAERLTAENEQLKLVNIAWKDQERERNTARTNPVGIVWPSYANSDRKSEGYGSAGCTCQLIESFGIQIDPACPVHGMEGE